MGCACAGNAGNVFPCRRLQRKLLVNDPGMQHRTCVTHVPWCMSGCLPAVAGKTFPALPAHAHPQFYVSDKRHIVGNLLGCNRDAQCNFSVQRTQYQVETYYQIAPWLHQCGHWITSFANIIEHRNTEPNAIFRLMIRRMIDLDVIVITCYHSRSLGLYSLFWYDGILCLICDIFFSFSIHRTSVNCYSFLSQ